MTDNSFNPYRVPAVTPLSRDDLRYKDHDYLIVYDEAKLPPFCPFTGKAAPKRWMPSKLYLRRVAGTKARRFDEARRVGLIVMLSLNPWEKLIPSSWLLLAVVILLLIFSVARALSGAHIRCYLSPAIQCRRILAMIGRVLLPFTLIFLFPEDVSSRLAAYSQGISWVSGSLMSILAAFVVTEMQLVTVASRGNWFRLRGCNRDFLSKLPQVTNPPI